MDIATTVRPQTRLDRILLSNIISLLGETADLYTVKDAVDGAEVTISVGEVTCVFNKTTVTRQRKSDKEPDAPVAAPGGTG